MKAIRDHFLRAERSPPTSSSECIAQTWSEHCKHKIFNATVTYREPGKKPETIRSLFKTFIRGTTEAVDRAVRDREGRSWLVSVFDDNAGVVAFDDRDHLVYKVETHNSPVRARPVRRRHHRHRRRQSGSVRHGARRRAARQRLGLLLRLAVPRCRAPRGLAAPAAHPGRRSSRRHRRREPERRPLRARIRGLRRAASSESRWCFCGTVGRLPVTIAGTPGAAEVDRRRATGS
mgnify:CR=1 FL=1